MSGSSGIHFEISERKVLLRLFDILLVVSGLYFISSFFELDYFLITPDNWAWTLVLILYLSVFGSVFELYHLQKASRIDTTFKNIIFTTSLTVLIYLLTPVITPSLPQQRIHIIYFYITIVSVLFLWRLAYITLIDTPRFYKRGLIIGEISNIDTILKTLASFNPNYKIIGYISNEKTEEETIKFKGLDEYTIEDLQDVIVLEGVSEIIVAIDNPETITPEVYNQLTNLLEKGFKIKEYTQVIEDLTQRVPVQFVGKDFYRYFPFSRSNQNKLYLFFHRLMDIVFSLFGILFGLILIPLVFIGNLIGNRGPLFYTQERVGKYGKVFKIIKFRTMVTNAEAEGAKWAQKNDTRVTTFGRILRNFRIDEFPQFINVLKGDMSVIGPRPERPFFVNQLSEVIPFYETRHSIKPGLSGWAQVNSRYGASIEDSLEKLQYDLYYIKHRSFFLDVNILVKTLSTVIYFRGQ